MPKQDCKSFRIGTPCCEFICLDDTLSSVTNDKTDLIEGSSGDSGANSNYDLGLRLIASCATAILSLSLLFFLIHRLRQRKIRGEIFFVSYSLYFSCSFLILIIIITINEFNVVRVLFSPDESIISL